MTEQNSSLTHSFEVHLRKEYFYFPRHRYWPFQLVSARERGDRNGEIKLEFGDGNYQENHYLAEICLPNATFVYLIPSEVPQEKVRERFERFKQTGAFSCLVKHAYSLEPLSRGYNTVYEFENDLINILCKLLSKRELIYAREIRDKIYSTILSFEFTEIQGIYNNFIYFSTSIPITVVFTMSFNIHITIGIKTTGEEFGYTAWSRLGFPASVPLGMWLRLIVELLNKRPDHRIQPPTERTIEWWKYLPSFISTARKNGLLRDEWRSRLLTWLKYIRHFSPEEGGGD